MRDIRNSILSHQNRHLTSFPSEISYLLDGTMAVQLRLSNDRRQRERQKEQNNRFFFFARASRFLYFSLPLAFVV